MQMPGAFGIVEVCERMNGWTLDQYLDAPQWFIRIIEIKMNVDNELNKK
ncbi:hypothetical protein AHiyo6_01120 [Arthrobacter sp. Hiyo6]|nr:hypothetical protein AHiyo6_01120 [Arthrobacter sp. Hiyo6]